MSLLLYLARHHARVVPDVELLDAVWKGVSVSRSAIATALKEVRQALDDDGTEQRWLRRTRRHGIQLVGPVRVRTQATAQPATLPVGRLHGVTRGISMAFVGRDAELCLLEELLQDEGYVALQASIEGLAGIGKTELALQLVYRLAKAQRFPGGIFWLNAERPDLRPLWGGRIADQYGVPSGTREERCQALLRALEESQEPVLVVLDNVLAWDSERRPEPLPVGPHVRVLVTTRTRNLGGALYRHLSVDSLRPPDDRTLLLTLAGREPGPGVDELLEALGGHALAIEIAGAYLGTHRAESAASYLRTLHERPHSIERTAAGRVRYELGLAETFETVWARLPEAVRHAWCLASCFAPVPATRELAAATGLDGDPFLRLEELHLVQCSEDGRWNMHRMTRSFAQSRADPGLLSEVRRSFILGCAQRASIVDRSAGFFVPEEDTIQFDAALEMVEEIGRPDLELRLILAVGASMLSDSRYSLHATRSHYRRAVEVTHRMGGHRELSMALGRYAMHHYLRGEWERFRSIADELDAISLRPVAKYCAAQAACLRAIDEMHAGHLLPALELVDAALAGYAEVPGASEDMFGGILTTLFYKGALATLVGKLDQGRALIEKAAARAFENPDPALRLIVLCNCLVHYQILDSPEDVARFAPVITRVAEAQNLPLFRHASTFNLAWSRIARDPVGHAAAISDLQAGFTGMKTLQFTFLLGLRLSVLADGYGRVGLHEQAYAAAREGIEVAEAYGEVLSKPLLWRLLARYSPSHAESARALACAIESAEAAGAQLFALRIAADDVELSRTDTEKQRALEYLSDVLGRFAEGITWPDLQRATALLESAI
jgi:tetratricopeptide (TPR) repeat protein